MNILAWSQVKYATKMDFQPDTGQEYSIQGTSLKFLNVFCMLWQSLGKNLEVGECVGRLMILFNGLRPSFPHFATPANKNSEISEFFLEILENFQILKSTHSVCFQLLLGSFKTFSLKIRENIYLQCIQMFFCLGRRAFGNVFFSQSWAISFCVQNFRRVCTNSNGRQTEGKRPTHLSPWTGWL